jgi:hypothetical protein
MGSGVMLGLIVLIVLLASCIVIYHIRVDPSPRETPKSPAEEDGAAQRKSSD